MIDHLVIFGRTYEEPGFAGRRVSYFRSRSLCLNEENEKNQHSASLYSMITSENTVRRKLIKKKIISRRSGWRFSWANEKKKNYLCM